MLRTVLHGAVVALAAGVLAVLGTTIGTTSPWPLLLAIALGLAAAPATVTRLAAAALGAGLGLLAYAALLALLPATASAVAAATVVAVLVLTGVAAATRGALPLWAGLAGYAIFGALYAPRAEAAPTAFLSEAPAALVTVLLALGLGALVATLAGAVGAATAPHPAVPAGTDPDRPAAPLAAGEVA